MADIYDMLNGRNINDLNQRELFEVEKNSFQDF